MRCIHKTQRKMWESANSLQHWKSELWLFPSLPIVDFSKRLWKDPFLYPSALISFVLLQKKKKKKGYWDRGNKDSGKGVRTNIISRQWQSWHYTSPCIYTGSFKCFYEQYLCCVSQQCWAKRGGRQNGYCGLHCTVENTELQRDESFSKGSRLKLTSAFLTKELG